MPGAGEWRGLLTSIFPPLHWIELDNRGLHPFPEPQMAMLRDVNYCWHHGPLGDPAEGVIGHSRYGSWAKVDPRPTVRLAPRLADRTSPGKESSQPRDCPILRSMLLSQQHGAAGYHGHALK